MVNRPEFRVAINLLADLTDAFTAALYLREPDGSLRPVAWHTFSRNFRSNELLVSGEGIVASVMKHGQTVDANRSQTGSSWLENTRLYTEEEAVSAVIAVPVNKFGVLVVDTKRLVFGEREKKTIRDFAGFFAMLILQQDTCAREAMYGRILDLFYDLGNAGLAFRNLKDYYAEILDAGRRYSGLAMGFLCLTMPGGKKFIVEAVDGHSLITLRARNFPLTQGLVGWVFRESRPLVHSRLTPLPGKSFIISPDEHIQGYNSFIGVPLLAWRQLVGVWAFAGRSERMIDFEEAQALQLAGHSIAVTIKNFEP